MEKRGTIEERGPGRYRVQVLLGREAGKPRWARRSVRGTRKDAERSLRKLLVEIDEGQEDYAPGTFGALAEQWYEAFGTLKANPGWYRARLDEDLLPSLGSSQLRRITPAELDRFYGQRTSVNHPLCWSTSAK